MFDPQVGQTGCLKELETCTSKFGGWLMEHLLLPFPTLYLLSSFWLGANSGTIFRELPVIFFYRGGWGRGPAMVKCDVLKFSSGIWPCLCLQCPLFPADVSVVLAVCFQRWADVCVHVLKAVLNGPLLLFFLLITSS